MTVVVTCLTVAKALLSRYQTTYKPPSIHFTLTINSNKEAVVRSTTVLR